MDLYPRRGRLATDIYQQLRARILEGRLRPGDALPATRELARELAVGRNTIVHAYEQLVAEGFAEGRIGAGTFVTAQGTRAPPRIASGLVPIRAWRKPAAPSAPKLPVRYDFAIGYPDPTLFPATEWRGLVGRQLRRRKTLAAGYPEPAGDPGLRAAIARHVGVSRAVVASADDVLVTSGAQQAFDLIGRVLVEPGACVAVEDPGFPPVRAVFGALGARIVAVPVDAEGLVVDALPADAKVVYVTPSHQFPLGMPMSLPRRLALLAWAERQRAAVIEDDYDSEFRFDGRPLEPLQSLDRHGRVIYVGTFSKVLSPSLRIGFAIAPPSLMPALHAAKAIADSGGPTESQRALAAYIDDGSFARHLRRIVRVYRERRSRLLDALAKHDALEVVPAVAGLHVSAFVRGELATPANVRVVPLGPYYARRPRPAIALGYGVIEARDIEPGIRLLRL